MGAGRRDEGAAPRIPAEPALRIGEGNKRGDGKRVSGKDGWVHRGNVGHASNQPPPISHISFAAPSSLNHDPTVPTRRDLKKASRETTQRHPGRYVPSTIAVCQPHRRWWHSPGQLAAKKETFCVLPPPKLGSQTPRFRRLNFSAVCSGASFLCTEVRPHFRLVAFPLSRSGLWPPPNTTHILPIYLCVGRSPGLAAEITCRPWDKQTASPGC